MRIDRHIYGSVRGYQTLARTDGITDADARVLEGLSTGAPASSALLAALDVCPVYIILPVGMRRAVTQIRQGSPDDQGRPTLLQVTLAVAKAEWDGILQGDVLSLIRRNDLWKWDGQPALQPLELSAGGLAVGAASRESADKVLALLSLLERGMSRGKPVLVREQDCTLEEFSLLERLLPPSARASLTLSYRGFSTELRTSFLCIAREAGSIPTDGLYRPGQPVDLSPYALAVAQAGFKLGHIPEGFVRSYRGFGMTAQSRVSVAAVARETPPSPMIIERMPMGMMVGMMVTWVVLAILVGVFVWWVTSSSAERFYRQQTDAVAKMHLAEIATCQDRLDIAAKDLTTATKEKTAAVSTIQADYSKEVEELRKTVATKAQKIAELQEAHAADVAGYVQQIHDARLPILSDSQRKSIVGLCERMVKSMPEDSEVRKKALASVADLRKWQDTMNHVESSLKSTLGASVSQQDAQAKLMRLLESTDYRKIQEIVAQFVGLPPKDAGAGEALSASVSPTSTQAATAANTDSPHGTTPIGSVPQVLETPDILVLLNQEIREIDAIIQPLNVLRKMMVDAQKRIGDFRNQGTGADNATKALEDANARLAAWQHLLRTSRNNMLTINGIESNLAVSKSAAKFSGSIVGTPPK